MDESLPLVIGHRGASARLPENTLKGLQQAFDDGARMVEFDVRLSRDGIPVVIHDDTLERTTNGTGRVSDYTLKELQKLDAGFRFDPEGNGSFPVRAKGFRIPSLEEVMTAFSRHRLAIEIKATVPEATREVLSLLRHYKAEERCIAGSLDDRVFQRLIRTAPPGLRLFCSRAQIMRLYTSYRFFGKRAPKPRRRLVASMPVFNRWFDPKKQKWIEWLKARDITVFYWTVNDEALMKTLIHKRVDGIMSDRPGLLKKTMAACRETAARDA